MITTNEATNRCNPYQVQVGSVFSRHSHGVVVGIRGQRYTLRNENGFEWELSGNNILEAEFSFADQFENESKTSRTKVIEILKQYGRTAMTIVFRKKPNLAKAADQLKSGKGKLSDRDWNKKVKELMQGDQRVIQGYHTNSFDEHQRLRFIESGKGVRLVDPRTIESIVVAREKFVVK